MNKFCSSQFMNSILLKKRPMKKKRVRLQRNYIITYCESFIFVKLIFKI